MLSRLARCAGFEGGREAVEQRPLTLQQLHVGLGNKKPTDTVDFGKLADLAGALWPLEFEGIADRAVEIEVTAHGECSDDLAAWLLQWRELDARSVGRRLADFLFEFALRDGPRVLAVDVFP